MGQALSIAVVIPSWNSLPFLRRCLESLDDQDTPHELLVVDNGSSDGSVAFLEENGVPRLELPRNLGFSVGVNLGAARVGADAILVLNADTVLEPGCLAPLGEALAADPGLGGVQPRIVQLEAGAVDSESARIYSAGQALTADGRAIEVGAGQQQSAGHRQPREIFGVCGAACLLRRQMFSELGGYDERYFAFYEDVDLNVRARILGWRFGYVPEAVVWHVGNASWSEGFASPAAENARLVARNRMATQLKFMPAGAIPRIAAVEAGSLWRAARERRLRATLHGKLEGLRRLPVLRHDRRRLRLEGDLVAARRWLGA